MHDGKVNGVWRMHQGNIPELLVSIYGYLQKPVSERNLELHGHTQPRTSSSVAAFFQTWKLPRQTYTICKNC